MFDDKLRLKVYKYMRTSIVNRYWIYKSNDVFNVKEITASCCFCSALKQFHTDRQLYQTVTVEDFPELMNCKPIGKLSGEFWFHINLPGLRIRIDILNDIIERLDAKISRSNNG